MDVLLAFVAGLILGGGGCWNLNNRDNMNNPVNLIWLIIVAAIVLRLLHAY